MQVFRGMGLGLWLGPQFNDPASLGAMQNFGGYIGGALAPTVTGFIVQSSGSFEPALLVGAAVAFCAAITYLIMVREAIPPIDLALPDRGVYAAEGRH